MTPDSQSAYLEDPERHLPPHHSPLPEITDVALPNKGITQADFDRVEASAQFQDLKKRFRTFAFPMTALFLIWYFLYVLLSVFAPTFMSLPFIGNINIGMAMGLAQFATTFLITWIYVRHANKNLDPIAAEIRDDLEGGTHDAR